jgi:transposase-like protein
MHRIEIVGDRRRAQSGEFRAALVAQSLELGIRVPEPARRNGICASLIYRWRRDGLHEASCSNTAPGTAAP